MATIDMARLKKSVNDLIELRNRHLDAQRKKDEASIAYNDLIHQSNMASGNLARQQSLHQQAARKADDAKKAERTATEYEVKVRHKEAEIYQLLIPLAQRLVNEDAVERRVDELVSAYRSLGSQLAAVSANVDRLSSSVTGLVGLVDRLSQETGRSRDSTSAHQIAIERAVAQIKSVAELTAIQFDPLAEVDVTDAATLAAQAPTPAPDLSARQIDDLPDIVTVLLFASQPRDTANVDLLEEMREIQSEINRARYSERVNLQNSAAPRLADLIEGINRHAPTIIHFSGHGTSQGLVITGPTGRASPISVNTLTEVLLTQADNLSVAFFNVCYSVPFAEAASLRLNAAIGIEGEMPTGAAQVFAGAFYSSVVHGRSVQAAFQQASVALTGFRSEGFDPNTQIKLCSRRGVNPGDLVLVRPDR